MHISFIHDKKHQPNCYSRLNATHVSIWECQEKINQTTSSKNIKICIKWGVTHETFIRKLRPCWSWKKVEALHIVLDLTIKDIVHKLKHITSSSAAKLTLQATQQKRIDPISSSKYCKINLKGSHYQKVGSCKFIFHRMTMFPQKG